MQFNNQLIRVLVGYSLDLLFDKPYINQNIEYQLVLQIIIFQSIWETTSQSNSLVIVW